MLWLTEFWKIVYNDQINNKIAISLFIIILSSTTDKNKYKYTSIHFANLCLSFLSQSDFDLFVLTVWGISKVVHEVQTKSAIQILIKFGFVHESLNV